MNLRKFIRKTIEESLDIDQDLLKNVFTVDFKSFPSNVLKTLEGEYFHYYSSPESYEKMADFKFDARKYNRWIRQQESDLFIKSIDKLIQATSEDIETINKNKVINQKLEAFEELIKSSLSSDVFLPAMSKFEEDAILDPNASSEDIQKAFKDAKNIIDKKGNIDKSKITPSKLFNGDIISLPQFEKFSKENPEYRDVFNDWKKLFDEQIETSLIDLNAFRNTVDIRDIIELRDFLVDFKKKNIRNFKNVMNEDYKDKYSNYKKGWIRNDYTGDLDLSEPISTKIYLFPNEKGFLVELYYKSSLIGSFHSFLDEEEGFLNDVEIKSELRNKGLGKILLLKAIDVSYSYIGGFSTDTRGLTSNQKNVYDSLRKKNIIDSNYNINYNLAQQEIDKIISELNQ